MYQGLLYLWRKIHGKERLLFNIRYTGIHVRVYMGWVWAGVSQIHLSTHTLPLEWGKVFDFPCHRERVGREKDV